MAAAFREITPLTAVDQAAGPYDAGGEAGTLAIQLSGTFVGTVTFESKVGGVAEAAANWIATGATPISGGAVATTAAAVGIWRVDAAGVAVRVRCSAYTSGTINVQVDASRG